MRTLLHVDMDAFFASVELLRHPEWRGRPLIVGAGPHARGVVSTCSYEARRFGVHSAMPSRTAYELCPQAIFTPPHMEWYQEVSDRVFAIFEHYTPYVEGVSIDEAFLDVTGSLHLFDHDPVRLAEDLRAEVRRTCGITCSVGIAPNRLLAKIGSEQRKPDGLTLMPFAPDAIAAFLAPKSLDILWGVGGKTLEVLRPYGLVRCGDVQRLGLARLAPLLGATAAESLYAYAFGRADDRVYWEPGEEKSVSREHTFGTDESNRETVRRKLMELVNEVGFRFRRQTRWARTARLKLRDAQFNTITRQMPFARPARDDIAFRAAANELFDAAWPVKPTGRTRPPRTRPIRLVGFGVANLQDHPDSGEMQLFAPPDDIARQKRERLAETLDALREKGLL
ncbi:MAG: DNA polymerase IV [Kiritimatiellia bacterium]